MAKKILLIEDYPATVEMIIAFLEPQGYSLDFAFDGQSGLDKMAASKPDLVLLDIMLPGMSGLEVCRKMKADPKLAKIPIVVVSAKVTSDDIKAGLSAGADEYLVKPFEMKQLLDLIKKHI